MKFNVLVVDDDDIMQQAIRKKLTEAGFGIISASDGLQALEILKNNIPDLIIMDLMLPKISGLKLITIIKRHYAAQIPVLFMSSLRHGEIILSALDKGASDFLIKPLNYEELLIRIKSIINKPVLKI